MDRTSSHTSKVPYARKDGRKSLLSKVKDSMRDILSPSWLSDLVSNVKEESPTKTPQEVAAQATPMVGGNVASQGMMPRQESPAFPPFQGQFFSNGQPRTLDFSRQGQNVEQTPVIPPFQQSGLPLPLAEFTSAQLPLARLTEKSDSVMAHEDTMSQRSDSSKSTSGCSSMIPQAEPHTGPEKRKAMDDASASHMEPQDLPTVKRQKLEVSIGGASNGTFFRRLSDRPSSAAISRPAFNASLFASPLQNDSSLLGSSFHDSSFYPGKTTYGGRSSFFARTRNKVGLNQSLPSRLSVPVKVFMKAKPRVNPNKDAVTSSTAKRILEHLDRMPTPLNDAKRIPVLVPRTWTESTSFFSRDEVSPRHGPPTRKLNISSQASISKNRQVSFAPPPPSGSTGGATGVGKPTRHDTVILDNYSGQSGSGKMRRDKSYHKGSSSAKPINMEEEDTMIIPDLRTDVTLAVSCMPKFSFGGTASQANKSPCAAVTAPRATPVQQAQTPGKLTQNFTFSSPIAPFVPADKPASPQKQAGFQFSSPISIEKTALSAPATGFSSKPLSTEDSTSTVSNFAFASPVGKSPGMDFTFSSAAKPKPKTTAPTEGSMGGIKPATELKKGSVMDILGGALGKPASSNQSALSAGSLATKQPDLSTLFKKSGWNCDVCLVNNKEDDAKCVACQTPKAGPVQTMPKPAPATQKTTNDLGSLFKKSGWTCDVCLISNKEDVDKCAACQTQKPGAVKAKGSTSTSLSGFGVESGNWICNTCLIQNRKDAFTCGACKAAKPATTSGTSSSTGSTGKSDSLFSKFKPKSGQWECQICLVQNKSDDTVCVACQTAKPLKFFKQPPGDWTCDTCLVNNKAADSNCVACNYTRPGPPRTQAVPSCAKAFSISQTSGFSVPVSSSSGITVNSAGGFSFASAGEKPAESGFKINTTNSDRKNRSESGPSTGGFKFDAGISNTNSSSGAGFKIDSAGSDSLPKDTNSTSGFKIGAVSNSTGGFQFGAKYNSANKDSSFNSEDNIAVKSAATDLKTLTTPALGSIVFGQKPPTSSDSKQSTEATTSVPGGFNFKPSDSLNVSKSKESESIKTVSTSSQSIAGFNFSAVSTVSSSNPLSTTNSIGGFKGFMATKVTEQSSFSQASTTSTNSKADLNMFSQKSVAPSAFGQFNSAVASTAANSLFSFGAAQNSTPATTSAPVTPVFGQMNNSTISTGSAPFSFGSKSASTPLFNYGTNKTQASDPPAFGSTNSSFGVAGQQTTETSTTSTTSSLFKFGEQPARAAAPAFGSGTNSAFGSGLGSAFGGSSTSTAPAFGATPPARGSSNASTAEAQAPAFGGKTACVADAIELPVSVTVAVSPTSLSETLPTSSSLINIATVCKSTSTISNSISSTSASSFISVTSSSKSTNTSNTSGSKSLTATSCPRSKPAISSTNSTIAISSSITTSIASTSVSVSPNQFSTALSPISSATATLVSSLPNVTADKTTAPLCSKRFAEVSNSQKDSLEHFSNVRDEHHDGLKRNCSSSDECLPVVTNEELAISPSCSDISLEVLFPNQKRIRLTHTDLLNVNDEVPTNSQSSAHVHCSTTLNENYTVDPLLKVNDVKLTDIHTSSTHLQKVELTNIPSSTVNQAHSSTVCPLSSVACAEARSLTVNKFPTAARVKLATVNQTQPSVISQSPGIDCASSQSCKVSQAKTSNHLKFPTKELTNVKSSTVNQANSSAVSQSQTATVGQSQSPIVNQAHLSTDGIVQSPTVDEIQSSTVDEIQSSTVDEIQSPTVDEIQSSTVDEIQSSSVNQAQSSTLNEAQSTTGNMFPVEYTKSTHIQSSTVNQFPTGNCVELTNVPYSTVDLLPKSSIVNHSQSSTVNDVQSKVDHTQSTVNCSQSLAVNPAQSSTVYNTQSMDNHTQSSTVNPAQSSTINDAQSSTVNPAQSSTFNQVQSSTFNQVQSSTFNQTQSSTFNQAQSSTINQAQSSIFNQAQSTINPAQSSTFNQAQYTINQAQSTVINNHYVQLANAQSSSVNNSPSESTARMSNSRHFNNKHLLNVMRVGESKKNYSPVNKHLLNVVREELRNSRSLTGKQFPNVFKEDLTKSHSTTINKHLVNVVSKNLTTNGVQSDSGCTLSEEGSSYDCTDTEDYMDVTESNLCIETLNKVNFYNFKSETALKKPSNFSCTLLDGLENNGSCQTSWKGGSLSYHGSFGNTNAVEEKFSVAKKCEVSCQTTTGTSIVKDVPNVHDDVRDSKINIEHETKINIEHETNHAASTPTVLMKNVDTQVNGAPSEIKFNKSHSGADATTSGIQTDDLVVPVSLGLYSGTVLSPALPSTVMSYRMMPSIPNTNLSQVKYAHPGQFLHTMYNSNTPGVPLHLNHPFLYGATNTQSDINHEANNRSPHQNNSPLNTAKTKVVETSLTAILRCNPVFNASCQQAKQSILNAASAYHQPFNFGQNSHITTASGFSFNSLSNLSGFNCCRSFDTSGNPSGFNCSPSFNTSSPSFNTSINPSGFNCSPSFDKSTNRSGFNYSPSFNTSGNPSGFNCSPSFNTSGNPSGFNSSPSFNASSNPFGFNCSPSFNTSGNLSGFNYSPSFNTSSNPSGFNCSPSFNTSSNPSGFNCSTSFNTSGNPSGFNYSPSFNTSSNPSGFNCSPSFNTSSNPSGFNCSPSFNTSGNPSGFNCSPSFNTDTTALSFPQNKVLFNFGSASSSNKISMQFSSKAEPMTSNQLYTFTGNSSKAEPMSSTSPNKVSTFTGNGSKAEPMSSNQLFSFTGNSSKAEPMSSNQLFTFTSNNSKAEPMSSNQLFTFNGNSSKAESTASNKQENLALSNGFVLEMPKVSNKQMFIFGGGGRSKDSQPQTSKPTESAGHKSIIISLLKPGSSVSPFDNRKPDGAESEKTEHFQHSSYGHSSMDHSTTVGTIFSQDNKCSSKIIQCDMFSSSPVLSQFHSTDMVEDIVMEECSPDAVAAQPSSQYSFSQPQFTMSKPCSSPIKISHPATPFRGKIPKSILKNDLTSAFGSASMFCETGESTNNGHFGSVTDENLFSSASTCFRGSINHLEHMEMSLGVSKSFPYRFDSKLEHSTICDESYHNKKTINGVGGMDDRKVSFTVPEIQRLLSTGASGSREDVFPAACKTSLSVSLPPNTFSCQFDFTTRSDSLPPNTATPGLFVFTGNTSKSEAKTTVNGFKLPSFANTLGRIRDSDCTQVMAFAGNPLTFPGKSPLSGNAALTNKVSPLVEEISSNFISKPMTPKEQKSPKSSCKATQDSKENSSQSSIKPPNSAFAGNSNSFQLNFHAKMPLSCIEALSTSNNSLVCSNGGGSSSCESDTMIASQESSDSDTDIDALMGNNDCATENHGNICTRVVGYTSLGNQSSCAVSDIEQYVSACNDCLSRAEAAKKRKKDKAAMDHKQYSSSKKHKRDKDRENRTWSAMVNEVSGNKSSGPAIMMTTQTAQDEVNSWGPRARNELSNNCSGPAIMMTMQTAQDEANSWVPRARNELNNNCYGPVIKRTAYRLRNLITFSSVSCLSLINSGGFAFKPENPVVTTAAPAQNAVFQFGAKPAESSAPANTGFNFNTTTNTAAGFNFSAQASAPGTFVFSAGAATPNAAEGRKIKKAVRKIKR